MVPIPTNMPIDRLDQPDLVYRTEEAKFAAVVDDIAERHESGQPVLVGTTSVEKCERLVRAADAAAASRTRSSTPSSTSGRRRSSRWRATRAPITVATNMAGRGTDIMLGGSVEFLADAELRERGLDPVETSEEYEAAWPAAHEEVEERVAAEHDAGHRGSGASR
ncbi:MAG: hypothetical protein WKF83_13215 [Nocardioidaceae bacterium]